MPQTHTEKDNFIDTFVREAQTTKKVLEAYPKDKGELKPSEKSKTARDLAWMLVLNQMVLVPVATGADLQPGSFPEAPKTFAEILPAFEKAHQDTLAKLRGSDEATWNTTLKMPSGPGKIGDVRRGDALWFFLSDTIHHRGQFSVYLRIAGGKLPSIYGPTADEKWF